jgi:RimJ/RimL family protein N-acetyltransferase
MGHGWEGEKVRLVPLDKARHLENALAWINDPDVTETTLTGDIPIARLAEEAWFERMCGEMSATPTDIVFAVETLGGEHVGSAGLHRIDWRHGSAQTGTLIGPREARGHGYGSDAARVRTRYAFEVLGLRLLLSEVIAENTASLRMLERAGYREVGRIPRRYWRRGSYRDAVLLAIERPA